MKPLVFDASPLIYLNRVGLTWIFDQFDEEKYTVSKVRQQVVDEGRRIGASDAPLTDDLVSGGRIKIRDPRDPSIARVMGKILALHAGEREVLALGKEINGVAITDDEVARDTARIYGVEAHGTVYLLLRLFHRGRLTRPQVVEAVDDMIAEGWRIGAREYSRILKELKQ